jgi:L-alanine-DL-glutamate epimerase-like enolase superfamily enzyme
VQHQRRPRQRRPRHEDRPHRRIDPPHPVRHPQCIHRLLEDDAERIGGATLAEDCARIEAVLALLGPGQRLAVDANGRFDLDTAVACGRALSAYPLFWYEEAGDPLDYDLQAKLGEVYAGPLATGENPFSVMRAQVPQ